MKVEVRIAYTIQRTPDKVKEEYEKALDWELLEPDGFRLMFADTEQQAMDYLSSTAYDMITSMDFELVKFDEENDDDS